MGLLLTSCHKNVFTLLIGWSRVHVIQFSKRAHSQKPKAVQRTLCNSRGILFCVVSFVLGICLQASSPCWLRHWLKATSRRLQQGLGKGRESASAA